MFYCFFPFSFFFFYVLSMQFIQSRCFEPVKLQAKSTWAAPNTLPSWWSKSAWVGMLATCWFGAGWAVLYGEHFLPEMPTARQTRLTWTSFTLPQCLPKSWDKSCFRRYLQKASPGCPARNMSLVSPSDVLASARRNSTGAGETSGEGCSTMTQGSTNLPDCWLLSHQMHTEARAPTVFFLHSLIKLQRDPCY